MPNKLSQLWLELKRRNVVRVITVYAGAAFVILELLSIIIEPLRLPDWTLQFAIVFLCIGFIVAVILSWIYDVHPEGGFVKTDTLDKRNADATTKSYTGWKTASYISFVVIVGLIVLNITTRSSGSSVKQDRDKSIAVLPFTNLSKDEENTYFIDGVMESILDNLCKLEDLRVPGRTSVLQYRENPKPIPVVAEEMDVAYVLQGSGQKIGNRLLLTVQLIIGNEDRHIWSKQYDRVIEKVEDLIDLQKEIAQLVAGEIKAIITPEEMELIQKIPTTSLTADDFYKQGKAQLSLYWMDNSNMGALNKAEKLYHRALEFDSTYALAYSGLGAIYWEKHYWEEFLSENFLDSQLILANEALKYDPQLSEAYDLRGFYFHINGDQEQAIREFDRALQYNPNDWRAYRGKVEVYWNEELLLAIENGIKAVSLRGGGPELPDLIRGLGNQFYIAGFPDLAIKQYSDALELDGDSSLYFSRMAEAANSQGNYSQQIEYALSAYNYDTLNLSTLYRLLQGYQLVGQFEESLIYCEKIIRRINEVGAQSVSFSHRIGYTYDNLGDRKSADFYFKKELEYSDGRIKRGDGQFVYFAYYDRACVYAYRGEEEMAMQDLRMFNQMEKMPLWMLTLIKDDQLLDNLRDDPEFQQIVRDVEAKYQAEHVKVRQWLEENALL